jgi:hypothetical protein
MQAASGGHCNSGGNQFRNAVDAGELEQSLRRTKNGKSLALRQRQATALQQNRKCRRVELQQGAGIHNNVFGLQRNLKRRRTEKSGGSGMGQNGGKLQHGGAIKGAQDFFSPALVLLRCAIDVIRPSTPLALISCANWVR